MATLCNSDILKERTKRFALQVIRLCRTMPRSSDSIVITRQLLRSATSVGANYRAVCRARSTADFVSKLGVVLEEADETLFWLELLVDSGVAKAAEAADLTPGKARTRLQYRPSSTAGLMLWHDARWWSYGGQASFVGKRFADE